MAQLQSSHLSVVVFLGDEPMYMCVATVIRRLYDEGHHMTIFDKDAHPLYETQPTPASDVYSHPKRFLRRKLQQANAILLLTDKPTYEIPVFLQGFRELFSGRGYSWPSYGMSCLVFLGSTRSRQTAKDLRLLLEDSYYPLVGRVLPRPCAFDRLYHVDPSMETEQPCVL